MDCDKFRNIKFRGSDNKEYMFVFDLEGLKIIKESIIDNCSVIRHCAEKFDERTVESDIRRIQYVHRSRIKNIVRDDKVNTYIGMGEFYIYDYAYDEYVYPLIIDIIDCIIQNKEVGGSHLYHFLNPKDIEYNAYKDIKYIQSLLNEYMGTHDKDKLDEAKSLMEKQCYFELEKPKKSVKDYFEELRRCFIIVPILHTLTDSSSNMINGQGNMQTIAPRKK